MKKIAALALAIMLVLSLAAPAFAAGEVSVTITHIADEHTFKAYQIFDGTLTTGGILTDITWGPGVNGSGLLAALKADTTQIWNSDHTDYVQFSVLFASAATADDVVDVLEGFTSNGVRLDHFAEIAAGYVDPAKAKPSSTIVDNGDGTYTYTIAALDPGYYIIIDETPDNKIGAQDYKTHYVLSLTTHTDLFTKGDYSIVNKTVSDALDGTYGEYVSSQINKPVYFQWEVNLDDDLDEFDSYYLAFDDELGKGLTFRQYEEIYVEEVGGDKIYLYQNGAWVTDAVKGIAGTPTRNEQLAGAQTRLDGSTTDADTTYIVLEWEDLKAAYTAIAGDDTLVVKYSATLNDEAVYGTALPNEVFIRFSNGPADDDYGYSVPDYAYVFSFGLHVNKVDADNTSDTLPGAKFLLYHLHGTQKFYAYVENGEAVEWTPYITDAEIDAAKAAIDADPALSDPEKAAAKAALKKATVLVTDTNGAIYVDGLKEGVNYYLHETEAPAGYNTLFTDVKFSIHPAYTTGVGGVPEVASITYNVDGTNHTVNTGADFEAGRVVTTVTNNKGNTLPSTGGFGTTMFYTIGGFMVAAAVVLLVTKKRMSVM